MLCTGRKGTWVPMQAKMAILLLIILASFFHKTYCQSILGSVNIDCGARQLYIDDNGVEWYPDTNYISTGYNKQVLNETTYWSKQLNSLRYFSDQSKNCYTLPAISQWKYLLRATFYYGNYDGQSTPPTFDLQFDGNKWATVVTNLGNPLVYEAVVVAQRLSISVCVARTRIGEFPFVSSIQLMMLNPAMYGAMESNHALFTEYRVDFGSTVAVQYPDDFYGRIWYPISTTNLSTVTANFLFLISTVDDDPPLKAVKTAVEPVSPLDPIIKVYLPLPDIQRSTYVALYFTEVTVLQPDEKRAFDIKIDDEYYDRGRSPQYQICDEFSGYTASGVGPVTVLLSPSEDSTLLPIISAMELYTVSQDLVQGTSEEDLIGLAQIALSSDRLSSWSGDPCLPTNSVWEWLRCNVEDPPRVTELHLSGYGLHGELHDFSQMDALEIIDMENNGLSGTIPDFLGKLPNLRMLNLANNKFKGSLPESLANNAKVSVNVSGNPLGDQEKNKTALIIGLSVGGALLFALLCVLLAFFLSLSRKRSQMVNPNEELGGLHGNAPIATNGLPTAPTAASSDYFESTTTGSQIEETPVGVGNQMESEAMMEEIRKQMESELGELVQQHGQHINEDPTRVT